MRRISTLAGLILLIGCGGGGTDPVTPPPPPPPPPPAPPGAAASIVLQAGGGQQAEPGRPVAVKPAVIVKDSSGRPVPNVVVAFAVDSGGGTLVGSSATTGTD